MSKARDYECLIETCTSPAVAISLCNAHYLKYRLYGDPEHKRPKGRRVPPGAENPNWRGGKSKHPLYLIYYDMVGRCNRPSHLRYADYGGRGIQVDPRWVADFWQFVADVGERPEGKTAGGRAYWQLDRIDNDGNYEPGNVRWSSPAEQAQNKRGYGDYFESLMRGGSKFRSELTKRKLTETDVTNIVRRISSGEVQRELAREYGVNVATVNGIWRGKTWAWHTGIEREDRK